MTSRGALLLATVLALGCGEGARPRVVSTGTADSVTIWTVTGFHLPGVGTMDSAAAQRWTGRSVRFEDGIAHSHAERCEGARLIRRQADTDSLLATDYRLPPNALPPLSGLDSIEVIEVSCDGAPWTVLGGRLLVVDSSMVLAPWDGTFFEMTRDRDFFAIGSEPYWELVILRGKEIRLGRGDGGSDIVLPAPPPEPLGPPGVGVLRPYAEVHHAVTEAHALRVAIVPDRCRRDGTITLREASVTIWLDRERRQGCGGPLR